MPFPSRFHNSLSTVLIPFPFSGGQPRKGVEQGPEGMFKAGLQQQLETLGWNVTVDNSIPWDEVNISEKEDAAINSMMNPHAVSKASEHLSKVVESVAKAGKLPVTVGGDHSLGTGSMIGIARAHPCLLYTSPSPRD